MTEVERVLCLRQCIVALQIALWPARTEPRAVDLLVDQHLDALVCDLDALIASTVPKVAPGED